MEKNYNVAWYDHRREIGDDMDFCKLNNAIALHAENVANGFDSILSETESGEVIHEYTRTK